MNNVGVQSSNKMLLVLVMLGAVITEVPATRELTQLFGSGLQSFGQVSEQAGQVVGRPGQVGNSLARIAEDIHKFTDKSKQKQRRFSRSEVARCSGRDGGCLYVIYNGLVLDLTEFAKFHVGGSRVLLRYGGRDATAAMRAAGMPAAVFDTMLQRFVVGTLVRSE